MVRDRACDPDAVDVDVDRGRVALRRVDGPAADVHPARRALHDLDVADRVRARSGRGGKAVEGQHVLVHRDHGRPVDRRRRVVPVPHLVPGRRSPLPEERVEVLRRDRRRRAVPLRNERVVHVRRAGGDVRVVAQVLDLGADTHLRARELCARAARVARAHPGEVPVARAHDAAHEAEVAGLDDRLRERDVAPHVLGRALPEEQLREVVHADARYVERAVLRGVPGRQLVRVQDVRPHHGDPRQRVGLRDRRPFDRDAAHRERDCEQQCEHHGGRSADTRHGSPIHSGGEAAAGQRRLRVLHRNFGGASGARRPEIGPESPIGAAPGPPEVRGGADRMAYRGAPFRATTGTTSDATLRDRRRRLHRLELRPARARDLG